MFQVKHAKTDEETQPIETTKRIPIPKIVLMAGSAVVVIMIIVAVIFSLKQDSPLPISNSFQPRISASAITKPGSVNMLTNTPLNSLVSLVRTRPLVPIVIMVVLLFLIVGVTLGVVLSRSSEVLIDQTGGKEITNDELNVDQVSEESFWQRNMRYIIGSRIVIALVVLVVLVILAIIFRPSLCPPTTWASTGTVTPPPNTVTPTPEGKKTSTPDKETPTLKKKETPTITTPSREFTPPINTEASTTDIGTITTIKEPLTTNKEEPSTISKEHQKLVTDLRDQIDALRVAPYLSMSRIAEQQNERVIPILRNRQQDKWDHMVLKLPTKLTHHQYGKAPIRNIGVLNLYRSAFYTKDHSILLSVSYSPAGQAYSETFWYDNHQRYDTYYLDLGEKADLSEITDDEWKALENLLKCFKKHQELRGDPTII
jgi:hypothetical protein